MKNQNLIGRILRFAAILLLGLTAIFHLLGGIGTSCVALFAERWESMAALAPYKWLYIVFVLLTLVVAVYAIRATLWLARGRSGSFRFAFLILVVGLLISGAHMAASEILRGSSAPTSMRVYLNALTLVLFLLISFPPVYRKVDFEKSSSDSRGAAAGAALVLMGVSTLTVHLWAGPTHIWGDSVNYADVWHDQLMLAGWGLALAGMAVILWRPVGNVFRKILTRYARLTA